MIRLQAEFRETDCSRRELRAILSVLAYQHRLLPLAWRLVRSMNAACPAAGSLPSFGQFLAGSLNATSARHKLLGILDPADELITPERR
jgi:hypothetical protein